MSHKSFIKGLFITSFIAFVVNYGLSQLPQEAPFQKIIFGSLVFFLGYTLIQYIVAIMTTNHPNKGLYIGIVQVLSGFKIALSVAFIVVFVKFTQPESNWFVLPFLLNYAIFTVFETSMLMRVGHQKAKADKE